MRAQHRGTRDKDAEDLDSFFIRGQELLTRLQKAGGELSETLFNALVLNGLPMRYESFVIQENFNPATNFTELRKRLQNFHDSTAQRHKGQSGSVALAVKRDFKKGPKKGNCFVCAIPGLLKKCLNHRPKILCKARKVKCVRILIRVKNLNLVLLEGLTYQINLTEGKLIQATNTDINES